MWKVLEEYLTCHRLSTNDYSQIHIFMYFLYFCYWNFIQLEFLHYSFSYLFSKSLKRSRKEDHHSINYSTSEFANVGVHFYLLEVLLKHIFWSNRSGVGPKFFISTKFPGDADHALPEITLREPLHYMDFHDD